MSMPSRNGSMSGSQFIDTIRDVPPGDARERAIFEQYELGNIPDFMRDPVRIEVRRGPSTIALDVLPDYLCIGNDDDYVRTPMIPATAQRIADLFDATLPTRMLVDEIWRVAYHVEPFPMPPDHRMMSTERFAEHNAHCVFPPGRPAERLLAGQKKDIVLSKKLLLRPSRVAIYGWHTRAGIPIQPLNAGSHDDHYVDYSHGVRLLAADVEIDGVPARFDDVLRSPALHELVTDEGPNGVTRYG